MLASPLVYQALLSVEKDTRQQLFVVMLTARPGSRPHGSPGTAALGFSGPLAEAVRPRAYGVEIRASVHQGRERTLVETKPSCNDTAGFFLDFPRLSGPRSFLTAPTSCSRGARRARGRDLERAQAKPAAEKRNHLRKCEEEEEEEEERRRMDPRPSLLPGNATPALGGGAPDRGEVGRGAGVACRRLARDAGGQVAAERQGARGQGPGANSPCSREKAEMQKHKLSRVIDSCRWRINNALDRKCSPRGGVAIVRAALAVVGSRPDYCVLLRNCEHVATELRYGEASSAQASRLTDLLLQYTDFLLHTFCLQGLDPQQNATTSMRNGEAGDGGSQGPILHMTSSSSPSPPRFQLEGSGPGGAGPPGSRPREDR
ncbi:hypothetical protein CRUP_035810 [Coryphaenoides rupestris]|nr:hypothetical protein CRUP_035810 [Coryphaenoides rupestris]